MQTLYTRTGIGNILQENAFTSAALLMLILGVKNLLGSLVNCSSPKLADRL